MSRRQSLDRPGILSPPGPFLTPSPSPSISASPRLQPSPSLSPFPQDVLLVTGNPLTNNSTHEQERKTVTPGRRQSIHQFTNGSPNAGTVVFQPSPSQSPAAATSVIGVTAGGGINVVAGFPSNSISQNTLTTTLPTTITTTGNELNTTLVGSNNIQLNKKGTKRQQQQQHHQQQQQQQQQHHQIFSSSSHYSHLPSLSTTTSIAGGYGQSHATTINNTPNTFATTTVASATKNQTKKASNQQHSATVLPISQQQPQQQQTQQQQQFQQYQTSSPLIADSPSPSPSGTAITSAAIKPPTPQPNIQMLQQQFTIASNNNAGNGGQQQQQTFQLIQGPQGQFIATATTNHQPNQQIQQQQQQQHQQPRFNTTPTTNIITSTAAGGNSKSSKTPQQILPKPQQLQQQQQQQLAEQISLAQQQKSIKAPNPTPPPAPVTSSSSNMSHSLTQISQPGQQPGQQQQQQQIILPSGATASLTTTAQQPLLLNQVPVLVQQNTPQGVQLILRPPTPQLTATPSLVIQNRAQPQLQQHQHQPQQVLRILGTNGATMQLAAATPTFIVSSQANLIQQANHLQTIKTQSQSPAITQITGLHAALSAAAAANTQQQRSQQFATTAATINGHLLSPSVAAQIQNLQLAAAAAANGNSLTAQIQMPNGLTASGATALLSQLPGTAQFQQNSQGFNINLNQLSSANIQQIAAAAAAAGATFQTPHPPPQPHNAAANNGQQQQQQQQQQQSQQNSGNNTTANNTTTTTNDLFSNTNNAMSNTITQSSPAHCPVAVTPEPLRQSTPVLQNMSGVSAQQQHQQQQQQHHHQQQGGHNQPQIQLSLNAAATIQLQHHQQQQQQAQIQQLQQQIQQTQNQVQQAQQAQQQQTHQLQQVHQIHQQQQQQQQVQNVSQPQPVQQETKKKPKPRKKKPPAANNNNSSASAATINNKSLTTTANKSLNTNTSTTSVLVPTITSTSNTTKMVPNLSQEQTNIAITTTNHINPNIQETAPPALKPASSPPPQIQRASNGKLDLGNVMKLCGITDEDDEDFMMDSTPAEEIAPPQQTINTTQNFTISIPQPNGSSESLPYTLSIPNISSLPNQSENMESTQEPAAANIVIKIDPSDGGMGSNNTNLTQPYSITIPRLPSQEEIQKHAQQHLNNMNESNMNHQRQQQQQQQQQQTFVTGGQPLNANITFSLPINSMASSMVTNTQPQFISNNTIAPASNSSISNNVPSLTSTSITNTTTATTAAVKPRRKPAAKRNNKKDANSAANNSSINNSVALTQTPAVATSSSVQTPTVSVTTSAISTPLATPALVPSQIGNIQISQIDNRLANNQTQLISTPMTTLVENKIQIMPIIDKNINPPQMPQLQPTQILFQPNTAANNLTITAAPATQQHQNQNQATMPQETSRQMQLVALPQLSNSSQVSNTSSSNLNQQQHQQQQQQQQSTITMPSPQINGTLSHTPNNSQNTIMTAASSSSQPTVLQGMSGNVSISVGSPNPIAALIPQLTGSLTLAVSEQCERLILRHDPNQPQDQQSQIILQALLKGALPNVTIINEPTKVEQPKQTAIQQQPTMQPTPSTTSMVTTAPSTSNSTGAISKTNKKTAKQNNEGGVKHLSSHNLNSNSNIQMQKSFDTNSNANTNTNNSLTIVNSNLNTNLNTNNLNMPQPSPLSQQRYVALPKIDPTTQQLFSVNALNNQITPISATQTAASIGPTERLLIAPADINAQQLAQCLQQGQIHFNPAAGAQSQSTTQQQANNQQQQQQQITLQQQQTSGTMGSQQPKQQIVYPMTSQINTQGTTTTTSNTTTVCSSAQANMTTMTTTTTTTKQVANVAPIIDQSKAKQDNKQLNNSSAANTGAVPKKKPVRKPKASTTTAADVALMKNASVVKPMPKLDPLSQKPNNNPVQIVQPNTASGKPVVSTSTTPTTTTTSNVVTIQPFQTQTSTGTKLVGVTAPMQQQPMQQNSIQQQQQQHQIQQQNRTQHNFATTSNPNPNPSNTANLINGPVLNSSSNSLTNNNPPSNQPQHTVSRVQTIQLTTQQQQMFRQVQMQIQYLTVKLQHKNLLSSMPLPADLDPNVVAAFNKPMTDMEINTALQRLFVEQHRILAAGKEIPTPEHIITNATNAANAGNSFTLMSSNNFNQDNTKVNSTSIPSSIVQPNNHSNLASSNNNSTTNAIVNAAGTSISNINQQQVATQKIHIYPIQQQQQQQQPVQQNKQNKQTKQQQQAALHATNNLNSNNNANNIVATTPSTSIASASNNVGNKNAVKQKTNPNQQQQQLNLQQQQTQPNATTLVNAATINPQLPQLSSLTNTPSLPSLPSYPSLPMINITNMPAVLQQKHFTQHLQMQQQQLIQQQQQKLQNANANANANANTKISNAFTTFGNNTNNITGYQPGPPPLIFATSTATASSSNSTSIVTGITSTTSTTSVALPQLSSLSQTPQVQHQLQAQIQFPTATSITPTQTFAVSIGNQKAYVPIITAGAIASMTTSTIQQTSALSTMSASNTGVVPSLPQLITTIPVTATMTMTPATTTTSSTAAVAAPTATTPTASVASSSSAGVTYAPPGIVKSLVTTAGAGAGAGSSSINNITNNPIVVQNSIFNGGLNVNIVGNPIQAQLTQNQSVVKTETPEPISPKAKLARLSLFLRQLEADQQSCLNPDYKSPFENKEEAVKRLIRYHCMYQPDEDIPSEEEEEFEKTAIKFQDKFRKLSGKFQQILLQESMLEHRTSEKLQMEQLMIDDLKQEIEDSKQLEKAILEFELQQQQKTESINDTDTTDATTTAANAAATNISNSMNIFDKIKNETKSEPLETKHNIEVSANNNDSNSNFSNNLQSPSASMDSIKNELKGELNDNSCTSSSGMKSSYSSMDSFDLLKQSPAVNTAYKKQTELKEPKKEDISSQWKQSYMDNKSSNSYYNHLANSSVSMNKPANHLYNGALKKQTPLSTQSVAAPSSTVICESKKDEKDNFENFDIESEITPSFIMKKQEPKEPVVQPVPVTSSTAASSAIATAATTATSQTTTTTTTSTNVTTKLQSVRGAKSAKLNHTFDTIQQEAQANNNSYAPQTKTSSATQPEVVTNNFDFSHHLPVNSKTTKQQEDDWLCIQKELNLINSVESTSSSNKNTDNSLNNTNVQNTAEPLPKTLDFLTNANSDDLFPNGCINKNNDASRSNAMQVVNVTPSTCNTALVGSSCSQQNQQPSLPLNHEENQQAADLNEFFSGSEDSEVHKDVETRLEAMFGESPVPLSGNKERSDSPDDIESGLESIFGESNKSASNNNCNAKEKSNWETDFTGNSFMNANQPHSTNYMNTNNSIPHHIQLGSANNPRWMQNMEAQFPDFLTANTGNNTNTAAVNDCLSTRKRQWNGHMVDDNSDIGQQQTQQDDAENSSKKMCESSLNNGSINDSSASSSSPLSIQQQQQQQQQQTQVHQHHQHHNLVPNDTSHAQELMDAALLSLHDGLGVDNTGQENPPQSNGFNHIMAQSNFASYNNHIDGNQQQQAQQSHNFMNLNQHQNMTVQQQQLLNNHMMQMNHHHQQNNIHGGHQHAGSGEFDDDITRHVQNAIDSILNLQSSEADSLSFSLDHSMGSFLGDTILNDNQSGGANNPTSCQESSKRRQLVDELGDCLMGNSSTGPTSLTETPLLIMNHNSLHHNNMQHQQSHAPTGASNGPTAVTHQLNNHHHTVASTAGSSNISSSANHTQQQINDFNCVVSGIDEAVKSIMTS